MRAARAAGDLRLPPGDSFLPFFVLLLPGGREWLSVHRHQPVKRTTVQHFHFVSISAVLGAAAVEISVLRSSIPIPLVSLDGTPNDAAASGCPEAASREKKNTGIRAIL